MKLPNPNEGKPFQRVIKSAQGDEVWGIRNEGTPDEEVVHIPTNRSNQQYWHPEVIMNPEGCEHTFKIYDIGRREVECPKCRYCTTFIPGLNFKEEDNIAKIRVNEQWYDITPISL